MSTAVPSGELGKEDVSKKGASGGKEKDNSYNRPECPTSPEIAKCAICLGDVVNRSRSNSCIHQFCFGCLLEWSKVKPECPLCKSSFRAIHHNFRSNTDFDEYVVPVPAVPHLSIRFTTSGVSQDIMMVREGDFATSYGLDLSLMRDAFIRDRRYIRVLGSGHQNPPISHAYDGISIPPAHSHSMPHYPHAHSSAHQRLPPSPNMPPPANPFNNNRHEYFGDIITDHRRSQEESFQLPGYQNRRRRYDRGEWVDPFGMSRGGDPSSVDYIRGHPNALARLNNWLHRELTVLLGLHRSRDEMGFIYELILHLINQYDIRSREFHELIRTYFTERSQHFQHEFYHFLMSGMTMEVYDRMAEYPTSTNVAANGRRNAPPEIITLDSDDEQQNSNSRSSDGVQEVRRLEQQLDDDIILLEVSSDDEESGLGRLRPPRDNLGPHESYRSHAPGAAGDGSSSSSTRSFSSIDFDGIFSMPQLGVSITRRSEDIDRPQLLPSSNRGRTFVGERDPSMPVLEPQVFPYPSQTSAGPNPSSRPRAPEVPQPLSNQPHPHSPEVELIHQHLISRPSVLSNSSTGNSRNSASSNDRIRFMDADFDFDLNVSLERYSSPPGRQVQTTLATPDFPILELRRNLLERERERDMDMAREISQDDLDSVWPLLSSFSTRSRPRVPENGSAFVPYEPDLTHSTANEVRRPPRPSCIHERGSASASTSRHSSSSVLRPSTPPFRIDLYPHGMSSSQVMDLSRSAGLVSSNAPSSNRSRTKAPEPVAGPSCSKVSQRSVLPQNSLSSIVASASSTVTKNEPLPPPANVDSDSDELECLGSFPIIKKPPLAVITLSSDGEEENVKTENNEERLNNLISEEDIDSFLNWNLPTETDLIDVCEDGSATTTVLDDNCQSSSSSSNLFSIPPQHASSSANTGTSAEKSHPFKISIRNPSGKSDGFTASLGESTSQASTSSTDMTKSNKYPTPKKSKGRKRIYYLSDDSSDEDVNNKATPGSSKSFPASIPKKRRFVEPSISPVPVQMQPDFDSCSSQSSEDSSETDFDDNIKRSRTSKSKKRSSSPKKKHKSKSKKVKKSKRGKDKEKKDRSKKDRSKGKRLEKDLFGSDSDANDLNFRRILDSVRNDSVVITNNSKAPSSSKKPTKSSKTSASATSSSSLTLQQSKE